MYANFAGFRSFATPYYINVRLLYNKCHFLPDAQIGLLLSKKKLAEFCMPRVLKPVCFIGLVIAYGSGFNHTKP